LGKWTSYFVAVKSKWSYGMKDEYKGRPFLYTTQTHTTYTHETRQRWFFPPASA
jgi:hypothetical protein